MTVWEPTSRERLENTFKLQRQMLVVTVRSAQARAVQVRETATQLGVSSGVSAHLTAGLVQLAAAENLLLSIQSPTAL